MPRHADPGLEDRILNAAQKLWRRGAEKALTMRAVAKAAQTNTPAVYRRFKNRQAILHALLLRIQQDILRALQPSQSPQELCERYIDFAIAHPHEYELFYGTAERHSFFRHNERHTRSSIEKLRPNLEFVKNRLAEHLGGLPDDHTGVMLALWSLAHGTAMLINAEAIPASNMDDLRPVISAAAGALVSSASRMTIKK